MDMPKIEIYTKDYCPYCTAAKELLKSKGVTYEEKDVIENLNFLDEMLARSEGRKTVPQIFINDKLIGGFDDLSALNKAGKLDALLMEEPQS
jgi:GrxC family glutaredoxin